MIRVDLAQERVHNGEHLTGTMTWRAESAKVPRKLEVACRWRVAGKGRSREEVVGVLREEEIGSRTEVSMPLEFAIPMLGPLTYDGKLFRIIWEVAAFADLPMARDEQTVVTFVVAPREWDPKDFEEVYEDGEKDEEERFEVRGANEE